MVVSVPSAGVGVAELLEAKTLVLSGVLSALEQSTVVLLGLKRENLEMRSVLPTALVTLSSVVLIRDMRLLAHWEQQ